MTHNNGAYVKATERRLAELILAWDTDHGEGDFEHQPGKAEALAQFIAERTPNA